MNYLIDTNVISELSKKPPHSAALQWLASADRNSLFLSVLTLGEIIKGAANRPERAHVIEAWFSQISKTWFEGRVLPIDDNVMICWGNLTGTHSRTLPAMDGLFAATALSHKLTLVTRNTKDFADIPKLRLVNPFV